MLLASPAADCPDREVSGNEIQAGQVSQDV